MYTVEFIKAFDRHYRVSCEGRMCSFTELHSFMRGRMCIPDDCFELVFGRFVNRVLSMPKDSVCFTLYGMHFRVWSK